MDLDLSRLCLFSFVLHLDQPSPFFVFHERSNLQATARGCSTLLINRGCGLGWQRSTMQSAASVSPLDHVLAGLREF